MTLQPPIQLHVCLRIVWGHGIPQHNGQHLAAPIVVPSVFVSPPLSSATPGVLPPTHPGWRGPSHAVELVSTVPRQERLLFLSKHVEENLKKFVQAM